MKKVGFIIFIAAIVLGVVLANVASFGRVSGSFINFSFDRGIKGSGVTARETREVSEFKSVDVSSIFEVEITAQKDYAVEVEADDNLLQHIKTEVSGGTLRIKSDDSLKPASPIRIRISAPDIEGIEASGASKVTLSNLKNSRLAVDASGVAKIDIAGETSNLQVDVSGASKVDAERLISENAIVDASGASHASVNVLNELRTDASGASKIRYTGSPRNVEKNTSGASSVKQK